jgi:signal transduction histidine kinase
MDFSSGQLPACIVLWAADSPQWADKIQTYFSNKDYVLCSAGTQADAARLLNDKHADALMVLAQNSVSNPFAFLADIPHKPPKPLTVLVTEEVASEQVYEYSADLIFSPSPRLIDFHLKKALQQRDKNRQLAEENIRLEQELAALKRASGEIEVLKNAIVRNVSHELKTPLLHVKSAVALLAEDKSDSKLIQYATDATARLEALVRHITLLGTSLDINPGPVIVRDVVEHSQRNLGRIWQRKDEIDRVNVRLADNLPPVEADKQGLSTVLQLLIDNALKFSKKTVEVSAEQVGDRVCIRVKDYGIGIAHNQLEAIFDIFYQVEHSSTRRYGGMGVGLAIVRLILDHHDSEISVESEVDKGSTFSFTLPAVIL